MNIMKKMSLNTEWRAVNSWQLKEKQEDCKY